MAFTRLPTTMASVTTANGMVTPNIIPTKRQTRTSRIQITTDEEERARMDFAESDTCLIWSSIVSRIRR